MRKDNTFRTLPIVFQLNNFFYRLVETLKKKHKLKDENNYYITHGSHQKL